jgi:hypothetical protein
MGVPVRICSQERTGLGQYRVVQDGCRCAGDDAAAAINRTVIKMDIFRMCLLLIALSGFFRDNIAFLN